MDQPASVFSAKPQWRKADYDITGPESMKAYSRKNDPLPHPPPQKKNKKPNPPNQNKSNHQQKNKQTNKQKNPSPHQNKWLCSFWL